MEGAKNIFKDARFNTAMLFLAGTTTSVLAYKYMNKEKKPSTVPEPAAPTAPGHYSYPDNYKTMPIPAKQDDEFEAQAWGVENYGEDFKPIKIYRGEPGDFHVKIKMKYCGICHTDVHLAFNHLGGSIYPMVPGHELVGVVEQVGSKVTKFKKGDRVAMGAIGDACFECGQCKKGQQQYCDKEGWEHIYNAEKKYHNNPGNQSVQNFGGYSSYQCMHENLVFKVPDNYELKYVGPIMCAGITLWDPLVHWGAKDILNDPSKKMTIGIIGIGGLGTMGIKLAKALGHEVVAISSSESKAAMAKEKGADVFVCSKN